MCIKYNKKRNKKWYDKDLFKMRKNLINYGKVYSKYPNDPLVKGHYYKLYREYSKARKFKYRQYKQSLLQQIESLFDSNPKAYWKLINDLKDVNVENNNANYPVTPSSWLSHFKKLTEPKTEFNNRIKQLKEKLSELEKIKCFNELDRNISCSEISSAISKIKNNKSPGLDNISNNMIKHSQAHVLNSLHKLFNKCFLFGKYPLSWLECFITPICKGMTHQTQAITEELQSLMHLGNFSIKSLT